jgi:diaminohydroxyphosphoribosylaminopyrimidine deaminase/5-amino-6-(5-phosphoribosylamino)uracil reductase
MARAIELAKECRPEQGRRDAAPKVGVVIARADERLAEAYRGEDPEIPGGHAEYLALQKLSGVDLTGSDVFTTLEPCSKRNPPKLPCAQHLIDHGVGTVFIGSYDRNPAIYRQGWKMLRDAGITLRDFPADLRAELAAVNDEFQHSFQCAQGDEGEFRFDWSQQDGTLEIETSAGKFVTGWSTNGASSIHVYARAGDLVADARFACSFDEIDDPGAFNFNNYSVAPQEVGNVAVFRNPTGAHLLVQVLEIHAGPKWGADYFELRARYALRDVGFQGPGVNVP